MLIFGAIKNGTTIAVIAGGFFHNLIGKRKLLAEKIINSGGAIISECFPDIPPQKPYFLDRNRIISALSLATIVIESRIKSGAISTANHALTQNKPLFTIPWNIDYLLRKR